MIFVLFCLFRGIFFFWGVCVCSHLSNLIIFIEEMHFSSGQRWSLPQASLGVSRSLQERLSAPVQPSAAGAIHITSQDLLWVPALPQPPTRPSLPTAPII